MQTRLKLANSNKSFKILTKYNQILVKNLVNFGQIVTFIVSIRYTKWEQMTRLKDEIEDDGKITLKNDGVDVGCGV